MNICFETFGCRLNKAEALQQEAEYLAKGWKLVSKHSEADLIVVRGCSVTARAQYEGERLVEHLKHHYPAKQILVEGCLPQARRSPPAILPAAAPMADMPLPTRSARAYLKVQDGCSGKCTFCIVPKFRGPSVSVDFERLIARARAFIASGYREIVVTGCNLALYASQGRRLPELLAALAALSPDCRIRLGSVEPGEMAERCAEVMAATPNVCRFLHLSIQSGSNRMLQAMGRSYSMRDLDRLLATVTAKLPGAGFGCDLMTGFPSESDLDYHATRGLVERYPFSNVHVFPYSERPGTAAAAYSNAVPKSVRKDRARRLARLAQKKRHLFARTFVGRVVEVVVESDTRALGWTGEYVPCEGIGTAPRKSLIRVAVSQCLHGKLRGRILLTNGSGRESDLKGESR